MKIGIGNDHGGTKAKYIIKEYLEKLGYDVVNYGTNREDSADYPRYAFLVGEAIQKKEIEIGILICKTGIGMSIAANKVKGVRCAKVSTKEEAIKTREHNHSNVVALSSDLRESKLKEIVMSFITTEYSTEERHMRRVEMIDNYDN